MCASYVRGDSMEPTLFDNDIILYDNFGYDGTDGIYAINYRGAKVCTDEEYKQLKKAFFEKEKNLKEFIN